MVLNEVTKFRKFNDPEKALSDDRFYSVGHISMAFARLLTLNHKDCEASFWQKIHGRKGFKVDDINCFNDKIKENIKFYFELGDLHL
mmetsp:Transcript_14398/g.16093  ORF Transcript_14398/g.16093 Transcript_14398/m.16093 type:complete len:87 (+) Transcript_14398:655-915(+)